jgi:hypothetical protein
MANLTSIIRGNKELNKVATQKTGNLKRKMNQANRPSNMIKILTGSTKATVGISLDIAPTGAEYGKYWNSPNVSRTVRNGKTKNVPRSIDYGKKALEDRQTKKELSDFMQQFADDYTKFILKELKSK